MNENTPSTTSTTEVPAPPASHDDAAFHNRVIAILAELLELPAADVHPESRLFDLGDSLDRVEAVMQLEEEFEIAIPDDEADGIQTVGELVAYVAGRVGAAKTRMEDGR